MCVFSYNMSTYDPRFQVPGNMQIVGPSLSGITTWLHCLVCDMAENKYPKRFWTSFLLTCDTHYLDLFAITLLQNLYSGGWEQATQNHNYHYTVLFKNPADTRNVKA